MAAQESAHTTEMPPTCICGREAVRALTGEWVCLACRDFVTRRFPEHRVEEAIDAYCQEHGYLCLSTSRKRQRVTCPHCGHTSLPLRMSKHGLVPVGDGCDKGVPDRLIRPPNFPPYIAILAELKGSHTPLSPEQQHLAQQQHITIVRSVQDLQHTIHTLQQLLKL